MNDRFDINKSDKPGISLYDVLSELISTYVSLNNTKPESASDGIRFDIKEEEKSIMLTAVLPGFLKNDIN